MPRFSIRDLFLATTLIAVGVAGFAVSFRLTVPDYLLGAVVLAVGSIITCGTGVGIIFQKPAVGAAIGCALILVLFWLLMLLVAWNWTMS